MMEEWNKHNTKITFRNSFWRIRFGIALIFLLGAIPVMSQKMDEKLFVQFEKNFSFLDSLLFKQQSLQNYSSLLKIGRASDNMFYDAVDSLVYVKTEKKMDAMMAETGLLVSGQAYYRLDEGFGIDDDDALSRYTAKLQLELRWNFLNSSLIDRKSRLKVLDIQGKLERISLERERVKELIEMQKECFRAEYDSLLSGVLQLRIDNLNLLNEAQDYLVSDRRISTDELLKIMDEKAIAERQLISIPRDYPLASQLVLPVGVMLKIDTTNLKKHIAENDLEIYEADLQIELLRQQEKGTNYWRTLNISPFVRYSHYVRPEIRNSSNVDAGIAFQIPLSAQESRKRKAIKAERLQKTMEKDVLMKFVNEKVDVLLLEIERANRGLVGELERIKRLRTYLELRKANYQGHIGEYNFLSRIKEYNHYLTCWENYYMYQYKRDCFIAELQNYLSGRSVLEFCTIIK